MNTRISTSFRLPTNTREQIDALAQRLGATHTQAIILAVDRMHREESGADAACLQSIADRRPHISAPIDPKIQKALDEERAGQWHDELARRDKEEKVIRQLDEDNAY